MTDSSPTPLQLILSILVLPFNVLITIPFLIWYFSGWEQTAFLAGLSGWIAIPLRTFFLVSGLLLMYKTISLFYKKGKGTLAPWDPTQKLVVEGPYRYVRNPMIAGVLCILIAEGLFLNSGHIFYWALLFFAINFIYFVAKEEPDLAKRFGADYEKYKKNVPRWIPRFTPWNPN